jgi:hypothetical protein
MSTANGPDGAMAGTGPVKWRSGKMGWRTGRIWGALNAGKKFQFIFLEGCGKIITISQQLSSPSKTANFQQLR